MLKMILLMALCASPFLCAQSTQHIDSGALCFSAEEMDGPSPGMTLVCRSNREVFWETELISPNMVLNQMQLTRTSVLVTGAFSQQLNVAGVTLEAFGSTTIFVASFCRLTGTLKRSYCLGGEKTALPQGLMVNGEKYYLVGEYDDQIFLTALADTAGSLVSVDLDDQQLVWPNIIETWPNDGMPEGEYITQTSGSPADTSGNPGTTPPETLENPPEQPAAPTAT